MSKIVSMPGVPSGREGADAVPELVATLRRLAGRAEKGEIRGFAFALVDGGGASESGWEGGDANHYALIAGVGRLNFELLRLESESAEDMLPPEGNEA